MPPPSMVRVGISGTTKTLRPLSVSFSLRVVRAEEKIYQFKSSLSRKCSFVNKVNKKNDSKQKLKNEAFW